MPDQPTYPFLPEDKCLSEQQLFDYIDGKMPALEMNAVEKHLLNCPFCSDALDGFRRLKSREKVAAFVLVQNPSPKEEEKKESKVIPLHPNRKWYSLAAALVLIIGIVSVLRLSLSDKTENAKMAENKPTADSLSPARMPLQEKSEGLADSVITTKSALAEQKKENAAAPKNETVTIPHSQEPYEGTFRSNSTQSQQDADMVSPGTYTWMNNADTVVAMDREIVQDEGKDLADKQQAEKNIEQPVLPKADQLETVRTESLSYATNAPAQESQMKKHKSKSPAADKSNSVSVAKEENIPVVAGSSAPAPQQVQQGDTVLPRMYPLKASDKDLDQCYENGVKLFDSGKFEASLPFFEEVLKNKNHRYYEDAQWKKSQALIRLNRKDEAKTLLLEIEKNGGKYKKQATEALKNY